MSNLENELAGEAASLPAGWDAHKAAAAAEIAALTLNDPACNTNLYNSAVRNALYQAALIAAYTQLVSNTADINAIRPYIDGVDRAIYQNFLDYADLVTPPPPIPPNPVPPNPVPPNPVPPNPIPPGTDLEVELQAVNAAIFYYNAHGESMAYPPSGGTTAQRIAAGRATLVANAHYLLTRNINWKGTADVRSLIEGFRGADSRPWGGTNGVPNGAFGARKTIDFWNGGTYLMDYRLSLRNYNYTTFNLQSAETHPKPPIYLGVIRTDGLTAITASYAVNNNYMTATAGQIPYGPTANPNIPLSASLNNGRVGERKFPMPQNTVGIPASTIITSVVTDVPGATNGNIIRLNLNKTLTASRNNQLLFVDERSAHIFGDGVTSGGFTNALLGRQLTIDFGGPVAGSLMPTQPPALIASITSPTQLEMDQPTNMDGTGHAWAISGGWGSGPFPSVRSREHWHFEMCKFTRLTNGTIRGAHPSQAAAGSNSAWGHAGARYDTYLEGQTAVAMIGGTGYEMDHLNLFDCFGDFFFCQAQTTSTAINILDGAKIHDNYGNRCGRDFCAPSRAENVEIYDNTFQGGGRTAFDLEPYVVAAKIDNINIHDNVIGYHSANFIASVGKGSANTGLVVITNNRLTSNYLSAQCAGGTWYFVGNTGISAPSNGRGAILWFDYGNNVTVQSNSQSVKSGVGMVLAIGYQVTGTITVSNNNSALANGGGLKPRPAGGYYQARFSRDPPSNPQTGYVYYPTP